MLFRSATFVVGVGDPEAEVDSEECDVEAVINGELDDDGDGDGDTDGDDDGEGEADSITAATDEDGIGDVFDEGVATTKAKPSVEGWESEGRRRKSRL